MGRKCKYGKDRQRPEESTSTRYSCTISSWKKEGNYNSCVGMSSGLHTKPQAVAHTDSHEDRIITCFQGRCIQTTTEANK